ncbi:MAG: (Fe-S)-binding protein [Desulfomonilaceae bacterium]
MKDRNAMHPEALKNELQHCLKCGMCHQVCPTFKVTRQEYYAPRGRVQIFKHYLEGNLALTPTLEHVFASCMLCDACAALCPNGVRIDLLLRHMRRELYELTAKKLNKKIIFAILRDGGRIKKASRLARWGQKLLVDIAGSNAKMGNIPITRFPRITREPFTGKIPEKVSPRGKRSGRVIYFTGCATDLVYGDVGQAVLRVLLRLGIEVVIPRDQVCCSAPLFLNGATEASLPNIFKNLAVLDRSDVDAIVVDCATCGAALKKEIPELLEDLGLDTDQARRVANKVKDVSQIVSDRLDELHIQENWSGEPLLVTYHDPCHLVRGMGVTAEPRKILRNIGGIKFVEMEGSSECCGGGGFYQFDSVDISAGITARKKHNVDAVSAQIIATGCPGCRLTLTGNMSGDQDREVLHTVQLLARFMPQEWT